MKIWIFNNYNMLPSQGGLNRHYFFAKQLQKMGHEPAVFVGSHPHNTNLQMIEGKESFRLEPSETFPWVYVKTDNYEGSKLKRIISMFQYYRNAKKAAEAMVMTDGIPEAVVGSSAHPLAAVLAIRLGQKWKCKSVVEIRDLWPESIVAYGIAGPHNLAVIGLRWLEKWIYTHTDDVVFTMEGAYDYIMEQGWEKEIPRSKVHYINNGVDLEAFEYNREHFQVDDPDLQNPNTFKVVYTGSIRKVNNLGALLAAAKLVTNPKVKFLIWGDGDERPALEQRVRAHNTPSPLFRFGISFNKIFDYFAAGKPILTDFPCPYNPVIAANAGCAVENATSVEVAQAIEKMAALKENEYLEFCSNALHAAEVYDFKNLTKKLIEIISK